MRTPELYTARLRLRPIRADDTEGIFRCWMRDKEVSRYMWWQASDDIAEAEGFTAFELGQLDAPKWFRWLLEARESGRLLGTCLLYWNEDDAPPHWDISYNLGRAHWGRGYAAEAMREVLRFAAAELGVTEIVTAYAKANTASARVLRKLGFADIAELPFDCGGGIIVDGLLCRRGGI